MGCRVAVVTGLLGAFAGWTQITGAAAATPPIQLGIVGVSGNYFAAEHAAGLKLVVIGVSWSSAEPTSGSFDTSYCRQCGPRSPMPDPDPLVSCSIPVCSIHRRGCSPCRAGLARRPVRRRLHRTGRLR